MHIMLEISSIRYPGRKSKFFKLKIVSNIPLRSKQSKNKIFNPIPKKKDYIVLSVFASRRDAYLEFYFYQFDYSRKIKGRHLQESIESC